MIEKSRIAIFGASKGEYCWPQEIYVSEELVLVIDDQAETRELIVNHVLTPHGYRSIATSNGQEGLKRAIDIHPDLIILNLDMPEFQGINVLESLQKRGRNIPAVLTVSDEKETLALRALCLGAREYVLRPFGIEEMLAAIDRALADSRLRKDRDRLQEQLQFHIQQQKRLYVIAQEVTSPLDSQEVLNRLVEAAVYITDADNGSLLLQDKKAGDLCIRSFLDKKHQRARAANEVIQDQLAQHVLKSGEPVILSGLDAIAAHSPVPALLQVPLKVQGHTIGVLRVARLTRDSTFDKEDIYMLSILAGYAAVAVENTYLHAKINGELDRKATYRISTAFGSTLRLESVLEMTMDEAIQAADAERGYITLLEEPSGLYTPYALHALPPETLDSTEFSFGRYIVDRVLDEGQLIRTTTEHTELEEATDFGTRAVMCVPISGSSGIVGAIYVDHCDHTSHFTKHQSDMLTTISIHAAAAIENAKLFNQAEAEHRKLEAVIRGTDQPVIVTDIEGTVLLMNYAARQAFSTRQATGTGMLLPQVVEDPDLRTLFHQAKASGRVQHGEIYLRDDRTLSATVTPISGVGLVAMMQDITQFKQLSRLKSEFVSTVSHDLRSPLSTVLGFLDVLDQIGPLNAQQQDFVTIAKQEVIRLIDLTGELLDLGHLEANMDMEMKQCDMRDIVAESAENWQTQAMDRQYTFEIDLPAGHVFVHGNAKRLRQVVDNLVSNAVKYTPKEGQISVHLAQEGKEIILRVQDSGIGIAPEDQPYLFDRFFRVHNEQTKGVEGVGLGLAIVQSIIERHNGRVWVESEIDKGSTFSVALPAESLHSRQDSAT